MLGGNYMSIDPELNPLSKLWCSQSYTFMTGLVNLRNVCVQSSRPGGTAVVDDFGDGANYHEVYCNEVPAVYEYEHLTNISIDSSNSIFGYTNWGAVYEIGEYISTIHGDEQKILDIHNLIDENIGFRNQEEVVAAFTSENNIEILTKVTPGRIASLIGKGNDILFARSYDKTKLGRGQLKKDICERNYQFNSREVSILSVMVTSSSDVLITTKDGYYKYNLSKHQFKPMFDPKLNRKYPIVQSMAFSDDRLTKLEIRCNKNHDSVCILKKDRIRLALKKVNTQDCWVMKVIVSGDGRIGVVRMVKDVAEIWDLRNQKHLRDIKGSDFLLSDNGEILLSTDDCTIYIWDVASGKLLTKLSHENITIISSMDMSKDGKIIVANNRNHVFYWRVS